MLATRLQQFSRMALLGLASGALLTLLAGLTLAVLGRGEPRGDEGTLAHLFQLCVAATLPAGLAVVVTADWSRPAEAMRPIVRAAIILAIAFALLFVGEHSGRLG